jgi:hypothetical protein
VRRLHVRLALDDRDETNSLLVFTRFHCDGDHG